MTFVTHSAFKKASRRWVLFCDRHQTKCVHTAFSNEPALKERFPKLKNNVRPPRKVVGLHAFNVVK